LRLAALTATGAVTVTTLGAVSTATTATAAASQAAAVGMGGMAAGALALASRLAGPVALLALFAQATQSVVDWLISYQERTAGLNAVERERLASLEQQVPALRAVADAQGKVAASQLKTTQEVVLLGKTEREVYAEQLKQREAALLAQLRASNATREANELFLKQSQAAGSSVATLDLYRENIQKADAATKTALAGLEQTRAALGELGTAYIGVGQNLDRAVIPATQRAVKAFEDAKAAGESTADALGKAFKGVDFDSSTSIRATINALVQLQREGKITADQLREGLAAQVKDLSGPQLLRLATSAQEVFGKMAADATKLSIVVDATASEAIRRLGVDAEAAAQGVSRAFLDTSRSFQAFAQTGAATGAALRGALAKLIDSAGTVREVELAIAALKKLETEGKIGAKELTLAYDQLNDRLRKLGTTALQTAQDQTELLKGQEAKAQALLTVERARADVVAAAGRLSEARLVVDREGTELAKVRERLAETDLALSVQKLEVREAENKVTREEARLQEFIAAARRAAAAAAADPNNSALTAAALKTQQMAEFQTVIVERTRQAAILAQTHATEIEAGRVAAQSQADELERSADASKRGADEERRKADVIAEAERRRQAGAETRLFDDADDIQTKIDKVLRARDALFSQRSPDALLPTSVLTPIAAEYGRILEGLFRQQRDAAQATRKTAEVTNNAARAASTQVLDTATMARTAIANLANIRPLPPDMSLADAALVATQRQAEATRAAIERVVTAQIAPRTEGGLSFPAQSAIASIETANRAAAGLTRPGSISSGDAGSSSSVTNITNTFSFDAASLLSPEAVRRAVVPVIAEIERRSR
jgi:hypothetical protein